MARALYFGNNKAKTKANFFLLGSSKRVDQVPPSAPIQTHTVQCYQPVQPSLFFLLMWFHLLLFILKLKLCPPLELQQMECDKGDFPAVMMSVQPASTLGMEMSLGTGGGGVLIDTMIHTVNTKLS